MGCDIHAVLEYNHKEYGWVGLHPYSFIDEESVHLSVYPENDPKGIERPSKFYVRWRILDRNYSFFADLAGVRGPGPDPKGVPEDASDMTKVFVESWGMDGHSHTYISALDFGLLYLKSDEEAFIDIMKKRMLDTDKMDQQIRDLLNIPFSTASLDDFRIILWFDN